MVNETRHALLHVMTGLVSCGAQWRDGGRLEKLVRETAATLGFNPDKLPKDKCIRSCEEVRLIIEHECKLT